MEFTLYYRGPLRPNGKPKHKHHLRQYFHKQIKQLWDQPPLNRHRGLFDPDETLPAIGGSMVVVKHETASVVRHVGGYRFASIVSSEIEISE